MPELPEVETVRRSLLPSLVGKTIRRVEVLHPKPVRFNKDFAEQLKGKTFKDIQRRGKLMIFKFEDFDLSLCAHLKMTGQFFYEADKKRVGGGHSLTAPIPKLPNQHTRVVFHLNDGSNLHFNDMRLFGYLRLVTPAELEVTLKNYGIEPGTDDFTEKAFRAILAKRKTTLKALLLNQQAIAGLGNIYVDEVCHFAGVKPQRKVSNLRNVEKEKLYEGCQKILAKAIKEGGTTFISFLDSRGQKGNFREHLQVFGRKGETCYRCGDKLIEKTVCAGRGTHFCPGCQR